MRKAIFLDRDGVINKDVNYLIKKQDIEILEKVSYALKELKNEGFMLIVVSNQPAVARGIASEKDIEEINKEINLKLREKSNIEIDKFYFCPHHPNATLEKYKKNCNCRKPNPGMILRAAKQLNINPKKSWMIGDRISDIVAGKKAGCKTILIEKEYSYRKIEGNYDINANPDLKVKNLFDVVKKIRK